MILFCTFSTRNPIFFDVNLLIRQFKVDFLSLRYIVVMHNKRTCNDVCKSGFSQDFRGAIAESLKLSTVSATFIPFIVCSNCNRLAQGAGGT